MYTHLTGISTYHCSYMTKGQSAHILVGETCRAPDGPSPAQGSPADYNLSGTTSHGGTLSRSPHAYILGRKGRATQLLEELDAPSPSPCSYDTVFPSISRSPVARIASQPSVVFNRANQHGNAAFRGAISYE